MAIIMAFLSAFFAGITAVVSKIGIEEIDSTYATAMRTCVVLIFSWWMVILFGDISIISLKSLIFLILSGIATGASWLCYFKALQLANINIVVPIDKSSTILTMLFSFIFLQELIHFWKMIGMIILGIGTWLMINFKQAKTHVTTYRGIILALLSAFFASLTSILGKIGVENIDSTYATAIRVIVVLIMAWLIVFIQKKQSVYKQLTTKNFIFLIVSGVTTGLSWLCYYRALQLGEASVVVPIDKLSIVVSIGFAYLCLKEKLTKKSTVGLVLVVVGTFLLLIK